MAAAVTINSGEPYEGLSFASIPASEWKKLFSVKRRFLSIQIVHDCRVLLEAVQEAETVYAELGFASPEAMIRDGYALDPAEVELAVNWLRIRKPEEAVTYRVAKAEGAKLAAEQARELPGHGGDRKSGADQDVNHILKEQGTGNQSYLAARIKRDHPEIHAAMLRGEYRSVRAAALEAGIAKPQVTIRAGASPETVARNLERVLSPDQRMRLAVILMEQS